MYCTLVQTIRLLFRWENKNLLEGEKVKMFYNLILFWQVISHFLVALKDVTNGHMFKDLNICGNKCSLYFSYGFYFCSDSVAQLSY
jgi:hypothetical protein